jgi:4'-phosphopantetheinyl transferase
LRLSISHSADWVAAAVADVPIGIDLEQRPRALDACVEALLREPGEAPGSIDADALLQRWVAKEAWIKRDAGSALPARLERLRLAAAPCERADVRIDSHPAFHLAVAIDPACTVSIHGPESLVPAVAFAVTERDTDRKDSTA